MSKYISVFDSSKFKVRKREIHKLVKLLSEELNFRILSLNIFFIDSEQMRAVNKQYMNHDFDTDIVTLDYSGSQEVVDAELYISYKTAIENAKRYNVTLNSEIVRLIVHGILHLQGYDDTTPNEKRKMKRMENKLTEKYSVLELLK